MALDVTVVIPVYNEAECIGSVIESWLRTLDLVSASYRLMVINDGSKDATAEVLARAANRPHLEIVSKSNAGHGPTVLLGYRRAVSDSVWVFQCDGDDEIPAEAFAEFWRRRDEADLLIGVRQHRAQPLARKIVSAVSRISVRLFFGGGVADVNCPFRLMRAALLAPMLERLTDATFAPNVILSGLFARGGRRILNLPVPYRVRRTGAVSLVKWGLWRNAFRAFWQTLRARHGNAC